jgi:DNA replication protein DnaC
MLSEVDKEYLTELKKILVSNCAICQGSGRDCECQQKFSVEIKKAQAHIPIKYRQFTLEDITVPESKNTKEKVKVYMSDLKAKKKNGEGLFLWSENKGTGKTTLGNIVLMKALYEGYTGYFTDLDECISLTTEGWFDDSKKKEFEHQILETDFLLIDDIGGLEVRTKGNLPLIQTTFTSLFKKRCNRLLPTIMTSNLEPSRLTDGYGERIYSVACEHLQSIECEGTDYRQTELAKRKAR